MNHPNPEEWVPFLYEEAAPEDHRRLQEHLRDCAECRAQLARWRLSLNRLDAWKLPRAARLPQLVFPGLRWALAAAAVVLLVGTGVALGRLLTPSPNPAALRAALEPQIRQQLRQEFAQMLRTELAQSSAATLALSEQQSKALLAEYARASNNQLSEDRRVLVSALDGLAAQHDADWAALKKDVDTLALHADAGLRQTEQQLVQLANYAQPVSFTPPSKPTRN